jgi:hypothetical protein
MPSAGYVWSGNSGCLLPILIIFNLFFGKMIFGSVGLWLGIEALLVLIFILKVRLMVSRISRQFWPDGHAPVSGSQGRQSQAAGTVFDRSPNKFRRSKGMVIDVQGQSVEEDEKELR